VSDQEPPYATPPPPGQEPPPGPPPWAGPPPASGQPPYAGYPYGYPQPPGHPGPRNEGTAVAAFVLAIASFPLTFACGVGFITAVVALVLSTQAERKIREANGALTGEGLARAARIMSWVYLGLAALGLSVVVLALFVGALGS
jgi:hypothetical protein